MVDRLIAVIRIVLGVVLIVGVLLNCANAAMRWVWGTNLVWAEEVLTYGMMLVIMAGTIIVTSTGEHLRMDAFVVKLSKGGQEFLNLISYLIWAGIAAFLTIQSWTVVSMMLRMGQVSVAARLPMWIPHGIFLVSFALCAVISLLLAFKTLRGLVGRPALYVRGKTE